MGCNVEIRFVEIPADDSSGRTGCNVHIFGHDQETVTQARQQLELFVEEYKVAEDRVDWVLGKGYRGISGIQDIAKPAGLVRMDWTGKALELCGSEQSIGDARLLLDNHV